VLHKATPRVYCILEKQSQLVNTAFVLEMQAEDGLQKLRRNISDEESSTKVDRVAVSFTCTPWLRPKCSCYCFECLQSG